MLLDIQLVRNFADRPKSFRCLAHRYPSMPKAQYMDRRVALFAARGRRDA
jgi:hypothetical protein